LTNLAVFLSSS